MMFKVNKYLFIGMLVMMICCVTAVSATDSNSTDDMIVTDEIAVDEVSEVVGDVEADDTADRVIGEENLRNGSTGTVNGESYTRYFDENGYLNDSSVWTLVFEGDFNEVSSTFGNFKLNKSVGLSVNNATFHNIGFDILANNIDLVGGKFTGDANATNGATIRVNAKNVQIVNVDIDVSAPSGSDFYAIDVQGIENTYLINNTINYVCNYTNPTNFNYAVKARNTPNMIIRNNKINATVPLKQVNWALSGSIDADYVAGVAIENCTNVNFHDNTLNVIGDRRAGDYPTLDAFIIAKSKDAIIENNVINENDIITADNQYSYLYGIDVYSCDNIHINNNTVTMNGNRSGGHLPGGNGTGAAYCIQLTGGHENVIVSNNKLTTKNQGPNLGIYSQNVNNATYLKIYGNTINVTGKAGDDPWSLVSGIEVQDTNAEVYSNNITVTNTAGYHAGYYAFGISYAQPTPGIHNYNIHNNNVKVINGDYAVYLLSGSYGSVKENTLRAIGNITRIGDNAVSAPSDVNVDFND